MADPKIIISGGGTGGHIFPAISIANVLKNRYPKAEILFVGAQNRMEMDKVPAAGYKIIGLPVAGFDRKNPFKNINVLFKLAKSMSIARKTIHNFNPNVVIGVGGYASGPTLKAANQLGIPTLIQEQNSYAGVTNKLLAKKASVICVAYENMDQFFPKEKIVLTGNPVRQDLQYSAEKRKEAIEYFKLDPDKKTILVAGGSLGARTINQSMIQNLGLIGNNDVQFIWQSGKFYWKEAREALQNHPDLPVRLSDFISRMDLAYSVADLVISRAGASSISELCILGKPVILIPSPTVAEDHQTKNALALINKDAAIMIADKDSALNLINTAIRIIHDDKKLKDLSSNISKMALPDAANKIADQVDKLIKAGNRKNNKMRDEQHY
jgi:UDP-N-acetylglucosamine--N-acetylmuramyl-(pentapeptide) pyrophosphoryl-undecaprenol N-acetylglucosamine transferase